MEKVICFDMDGTIADLYVVKGWCEQLNAGEVLPYLVARPMWDMGELAFELMQLRELGFRIEIISWASKSHNDVAHNRLVKEAKLAWLEEMDLLECFDSIHVVKYGTPKHTVSALRRGILVDDNKDVREAWENYGGETIDPTAVDLLEALRILVEKGEI